jgi:8-oxo-dGTP diphosphatase
MTDKAAQEQYCYEHPHPSVTVDIVLFRRVGEKSEVLLIQRKHDPFKGFWCFPGGFVDRDEALDDAATRELEEETGLSGIDLTQLGAFGEPGRDPRGHTISIAFIGRCDASTPDPVGSDDAADARWWDVSALPELGFDHDKMLREATRRMPDESSVQPRS